MGFIWFLWGGKFLMSTISLGVLIFVGVFSLALLIGFVLSITIPESEEERKFREEYNKSLALLEELRSKVLTERQKIIEESNQTKVIS